MVLSHFNKHLGIFFLYPFLFASCIHKDSNQLLIATAANMQFAMKEIGMAFTKETGIECHPIFSSSGKLTAQIMEGAPYDIFVSADLKYPRTLFEKGFTSTQPKIYAYGNLVLWTMDENRNPNLTELDNSNIKHIAIANPDIAPYGMAAIEILKYNKIYKKLKTKLVYGESVSQTNQFIISEAAEIGFTSKSVVKSPEMIGKGNWTEMDTNHYSPIAQAAVILKNGKSSMIEAQMFYDFLYSDKCREILNNFGYSISIE